MAYEKQMSSASPGYLVFLIDQSGSMEDDYNGESKADFTAVAINKMLDNIIIANTTGNSVKDRCFISLIGYGGNNGVEEIWSDYLSKFADNPLRLEKRKQLVSDGAGGLIEREIDFPVWIDPVAGYQTPMGEAFERAKQLVQEWINSNPDFPAPIVINITDGLPNDEQLVREHATDLKSLQCKDGNVLVFNIHIEKGGNELYFPTTDSSLPNEYKFLYHITSVIPENYYEGAEKAGLGRYLQPNCRGYIFNAKPEDLIRFLRFGSSKTQAGGDKRI